MEKFFVGADLLASFLPDYFKKIYLNEDDTSPIRVTHDLGSDQLETDETPNIVCFPSIALVLRVTNADQIWNDPLLDQWNDHFVTDAKVTTRECDVFSLLSQILDVIVPIISRCGGDVLWFTGESVLAIFRIEDEETSSVLLRAISCGRSLTETIQSLELAHDPSLKLKAVVGVGGADKENNKINASIFSGFVGGYLQKWQFVAGGYPIAKANELVYDAEVLAQGATVVLASELYDLVRTRCDASPLSTCIAIKSVHLQQTSPKPVIERTKSKLRMEIHSKIIRNLWKHVPVPAQLVIGLPNKKEAHNSDSLFWMNESRYISVLCINYTNLEYSWSTANLIHQIIHNIQKVAAHFNGVIVNTQSTISEGTLIEIAFGVPMMSREGTGIAAVLAGMAILQQHKQLLVQIQQQNIDEEDEEYDHVPSPHSARLGTDLGCRIGVATGQAICGIVGSNFRREYVVVGKVIERSRLLTRDVLPASSDTKDTVVKALIRCDNETRESSAHVFQYVKIARDIYQPVKRTDVEMLRPETSTSEYLVGRQNELMVLHEHLQNLSHNGIGGLVLVEGASGIGKSRLVREFCWMCRSDTQTYLDGSGDISDHVTPFFAWRRIFSQLFKFNLVSRNGHETDTNNSISSSSSDNDLRSSNNSCAPKSQVDFGQIAFKQIESLPPAIAMWMPLLVPLIPELQAYVTPEMVDLRRLKREAAVEKTLEFLLYLLQECSKDNPLVIIIDNIQWLDPHSWRFLSICIKTLPSVLFVFSGRGFAANENAPQEYQKMLKQLQSSLGNYNSHVASTRLILKPLSNHESVKLVSYIMNVEKYEDFEDFDDNEIIDVYNHAEKQLLQKSARSNIIEKVVELGQGNPFYMEKLVQCIITRRREVRIAHRRPLRRFTVGSIGDRPPSRLWRRNKVADIHSTSGSAEPTTPTQSPRAPPISVTGPHLPMLSFFIPDSVLDLIASQFDNLSTEQRLVLKVASVMGTFELKILDGVFPPIQKQRMNLRAEVEALEKLGYFLSTKTTTISSQSTQGSTTTVYSFSHIIVQEAIYKMLLNQKILFHSWVADWHDKKADEHPTIEMALLALHFSRANNLKKTLRYSILAGDNAFTKYQYGVALDFYLAALRLASALPSKPANSGGGLDAVMLAAIERKIGQCFVILGSLREAITHYKAALTLLKQPLPSNANVTSLLGEFVLQGWRRYTSSKPSTTITRDVAEAVKIYIKIGECYIFSMAHTSKALFSFIRSINLAEGATNPPAELAIGLAYMVVLSHLATNFSSLPGNYERMMTEMMQKMDKGHDPADSCICEANVVISTFYAAVGNFQMTDSLLSAAIQAGERVGSRISIARARNDHGFIKFREGSIEIAEKNWKTVLASARPDDIESITIAKIGRISILVAKEKTQEAMKMLEDIDHNVSPLFRTVYYGLLAMCYLQSDRPQVALDIASSVIDTILQYRFHSVVTESYFYTLEVLLLVWEADTQSKILSGDLKNKAKALLSKIDNMLIKIPAAKPRALIYRGMYEWVTGNLTKAERRWQEALALAGSMRLKLDQAMASYELERHYLMTTKHYRAETSLFAQIGLPKPFRPGPNFGSTM